MLSGHRAHSHPYSPNLIATNLVDRPSQRKTATPSPDIPSREVRSEPNIISTTLDYDRQSILHTPSVSSRPASSASNHEELQPIYHAPLRPSSASHMNHDKRPPPPLHAPVLSIRDEPDGWSIAFDQRVKPSIDVKLVEVLIYEEAVACVRFSPDGNSLAVGLDTGRTYIHNMLGEKSW
jgi:hypothetical protein